MTAPTSEPSADTSAVLAWLEQGRDIHAQWLAYLESDPVSRGELTAEAVRAVGGLQWHRDRIVGYGRAIATTRAAGARLVEAEALLGKTHEAYGRPHPGEYISRAGHQEAMALYEERVAFLSTPPPASKDGER